MHLLPRVACAVVVTDRDPDAGDYPTSSPTTLMVALDMLLTIATTLGWEATVADITSTFLQGEPLPRDKPLYIRLPKLRTPALTIICIPCSSCSCRCIVRSSAAVGAASAAFGFEHGEFVWAILCEM